MLAGALDVANKAKEAATDAATDGLDAAKDAAKDAGLMKKNIGIFGGTGNSGKWAVKACIQRGFKVRVWCRSEKKLQSLLKQLFGEQELAKIGDDVKVFECAKLDDPAKLKEFASGVDFTMSFLGMVAPPAQVVHPFVRAYLPVLKEMGATAPPHIHMSSIALNDSYDQGIKAWGRCVTCCALKCRPLGPTFQDMNEAEQFIMQMRKDVPYLRVTLIRGTILEDKKDYYRDFKDKTTKGYAMIPSDDLKSKVTFNIDRQHVAEAFVDVVEDFEKGDYANKNVSIFAGDKNPKQQPKPELVAPAQNQMS
jgi:hypothetical protein